jgi:hypothetical protein
MFESRDETFIKPTIPLINYVPSWAAKAIGANFLIILFLPFSIFFSPQMGWSEFGQLALGLFITAVLVSVVAISIPTLGETWVNVSIYAILQIILLFEIARYGRENNLQA